ncbi:tellurite resistance TerB family protein [Salinicola halophilus]|uniref:tellurite resistance TerB family protein n=1 Tax=Salinicola halophilus TaxID=184065 RepID=UPI000DA1A49E|nr:tellurite resistance TerB family protein [Salinicola halophilus]
MNAQKILSQLMNQAKSAGESTSGSQRGGFDVKSLLGGGALGLLVGSKRGRSLGGKAVKYGALAGLGALAYKAWQAHQANTGASDTSAEDTGRPLETLDGDAQERRSRVILQAMIATARADGHIDEEERAALTDQIDALGADDELHTWVERQMVTPLDADVIASEVDSPQAGREAYLASLAIADDQNPMERAWLDQLAAALELDAELRQTLERQVQSPAT